MALVVGAAAAVGGYALIDDQDPVQAQPHVVFVDIPAPGEGVRGIDDTAKAAALGSDSVDSDNWIHPRGAAAAHHIR